jgi:hypothetical protein
MQALIQPLLKPPCIIIELLSAGDTAKFKTQLTNE